MLKRAFFILCVVAILGVGGYYGWGRLQETVRIDPPQLVSVRKDVFVHEILGRGSVDSAKNVEIRCRVEGAGQAGLTIVYVIDEGTLVKEGDLLIELESSRLKDDTERQQIVVINSESRLTQSKADLGTAKLTLEEYLQGKLEQDRMSIANRIFVANEQVSTQQDNLTHSQRLFERGYITQAQVDAALFELERATQTIEQARLDLRVLNTLTQERMIMQYQAAIDTARAKVAADEKTLEIDTGRLEHLVQQLANCRIYAPSDGQVVYFTQRWGGEETLIREGRRVMDREILLHLPDPTQMQVKGLINEANVRFVKPGQRATIRLEAFLNDTFQGEVTMVNPYPEPSNFQGGAMSREYMTTIRIYDPPEGVKTGLTAEARIVVNEIPDALLLPTQAIFTHGGRRYAITFNDGRWDKVEVITGPANDRDVVILSGLSEGDEVVLGSQVHRDKVDLPRVEDDLQRSDDSEEDDGPYESMRQETVPLAS
ncbi:MAG: efflux RND transporter periplasmic adaptor subunit [Planctomycetaceae bacterium]|nr:efflux RND transporter periplasmic adaptor subunit [Planctomycetaceae bacterium]